jgi:hypothetical protein
VAADDSQSNWWVVGKPYVAPLVIAIVSGGVAMTGTVTVIGEQLAQCKANIIRIERALERIHSDMYRPSWLDKR